MPKSRLVMNVEDDIEELLTSALSNLGQCLLDWPPPGLAQHLFAFVLIDLLCRPNSLQTAACEFVCCQHDGGAGSVADDAGDPAGW